MEAGETASAPLNLLFNSFILYKKINSATFGIFVLREGNSPVLHLKGRRDSGIDVLVHLLHRTKGRLRKWMNGLMK